MSILFYFAILVFLSITMCISISKRIPMCKVQTIHAKWNDRSIYNRLVKCQPPNSVSKTNSQSSVNSLLNLPLTYFCNKQETIIHRNIVLIIFCTNKNLSILLFLLLMHSKSCPTSATIISYCITLSIVS